MDNAVAAAVRKCVMGVVSIHALRYDEQCVARGVTNDCGG
jgi:hypothetical protein